MPDCGTKTVPMALEVAYQALPWLPVNRWQPGDRCIDLVCDRLVTTSGQTPTALWHGEAFFFCSRSCQRRFEMSPGDYLPVNTYPINFPRDGVQHGTS